MCAVFNPLSLEEWSVRALSIAESVFLVRTYPWFTFIGEVRCQLAWQDIYIKDRQRAEILPEHISCADWNGLVSLQISHCDSVNDDVIINSALNLMSDPPHFVYIDGFRTSPPELDRYEVWHATYFRPFSAFNIRPESRCITSYKLSSL